MRISDRLPAFLRDRLAGRATVRQSLDNSFWLFADQIVRMGVGLLVGVWVTRYLGPEQFGWLSYATAIVATVGAFTSVGLNAVVVRELVRTPAETNRWLGAAFLLKVLGAVLGFAICAAIAWVQPMPGATTRLLVVLVAAGMFFQVLDVFDLYFQAQGASRISALVRIATSLGGSLLRIALLLAHASLVAFVVAGLVELAFAGWAWVWTGRRAGRRITQFDLDWPCVVLLLRENWPLAISGLAIYSQAYADQLMIGALLGGSELGQYAAAMRLVSVFSFVPMVMNTVAAPEITRAKRDDGRLYCRRLHNFYRLMMGLFVLTALPLIFVGPPVVRLLYGASYAGAATLLPWLAFRLFFTNFGVARSVYLTNENLFRLGLVTAVVGAIVNLLLNLWWIPAWGARGAIGASLVSFALTTFGLDGFHRQARFNLRLMLTAVFLPWRRFVG
jgi:O-antigen/teichoic acid export membrane protein